MEIVATILRYLTIAALAGLALIAVYWTFGFFAQRSVMFPVPRAPVSGAPPPDVRQIWLPTSAGRVEAWLLEADARDGGAPLMIFTHGNAELIDYWPPAFEEARRAGVHVLLVEYPGYGRSEGRPSQKSIRETMVAAYDAVAERPSVDRERIIAYGRSLGGGAAALLTTERPVAALVLESTFTAVWPFARQFGLPRFLVRDRFDNVAAVTAFAGPILLLHGREDDVIPHAHSIQLQEVADRAMLKLMPCGHNDCPSAWPDIRRFLEMHGLLAHDSAN